LADAATAARWRQIDGCPGDPTQDLLPANGPQVLRFTASGCAAGTAVVFIQIDGGGHGWPNGTPGHGPDAAEITWQFLAAHPRENA
jgi:polyhydroxybutyrate depolymerase